MDVNLIAVIMGTRLALTQMKKQPAGGVIVNIASLAGLYPQPHTPIYSTSKSGVVMLTRSLSPALPSKIRINAVCFLHLFLNFKYDRYVLVLHRRNYLRVH